MTTPIFIKVLVSCPNDVITEKDEIISICATLTKSNEGYSNVCFVVKDWRDYVGIYGTRPQEQLKNFFGEYDIYIGILWKRFGSKPGSKNSVTGLENDSGTEEEFYDAIERWEKDGKPEISLFFKTFNKDVNSSQESEQLTKVFKFIELQKSSGKNFVNEFETPESFRNHILYLLNKKQQTIIYGKRIEEKRSILTEEVNSELFLHQVQINPLPLEYIARSTTHFSNYKDKHVIPFLETDKQSLDQLVFSKYRVVLLGDAGSGKSTELRNLFHKLSLKESTLIPIYQNLNTYTPDQGIEAFLPNFWKKIPTHLLQIIWDGLDEIQPEHFNTVLRQISSFSSKFNDIRILISCRTNFYELPINGSPGTLPGYEPYFLNDLVNNDIKDFYQKKYLTSDSTGFLIELFDNNLNDLITKPFFLMLLADNYSRTRKLSLNRADLYEMFLLNRIQLDEIHYKNSFNIKGKKKEIVSLLERVAISMEILSKNHIQESEILEIVSFDEFNTLKHCTAFKKKDGEDETWQFEHNNIQEFLAAKVLTRLDFNSVIKFLTFEPNYKRLIPSWVNTLAFLFSILKLEDELFKLLLDWLLRNEREIIVKFERDKVPEELRNEIFLGIFNHYKLHDVRISSNKFNDRELALFGQSTTNILFLVNEIKQEENSKIVKLNAIHILSHCELDNVSIRKEIEEILLNQIKSNTEDPHFISASINALRWTNLTDRTTIKLVMDMVSSRKNQYIRSAVYSILSKSSSLEDYIEYIIEGFELIDKKIKDERDDVTFIDEGWNLKECIRNIKSPDGIKKIISYISKNSRFDQGYETEKNLKAIIDNAINAYKKDNSIYDTVLMWFMADTKSFRKEKSNIILSFFDLTGTREKAFNQIWNSQEDIDKVKSLAIAKLLTQSLMHLVIDQFNSHNLTNNHLESILLYMNWVGNLERDTFERLLLDRTEYEIRKPELIDYEVIRKKKLNEDFSLLFDNVAFKNETLRVFEEQGKETLSYDELFEIRKENNIYTELEDYYSSIALRLLRDFVHEGQTVRKSELIRWFDNAENEKWYRVSLIYEYLNNNKDLEIAENQSKWIVTWCEENVSKINFRESIEVNEGGQITFKSMAIYISYFSRKFNINYSREILLDMLSFDFFENSEWVGIEHLIIQLDKVDIIHRMLENLNKGIADSSVLKNHIKFLSQNKVKEGYGLIIKEIVNTRRSDYHRREYLDIFFDNTKETHGLKDILDMADSDIKWLIIDKLKTNNEEVFVEKFLIKEISKNITPKEKGKIAEILVTLQNLQGLQAYVDWITNNTENNIDIERVSCLNSLRTKSSIPLLMKLLELSYIRDIKVDEFDRFNNQVISALFNVALVSEINFMEVKESLSKFMIEKSSIHKNVKYLVHTIERLDDKFYLNRSHTYTITEVKEKLKLIRS